MTPNDDLDLKEWAGDWQAAPYDQQSAEQIRRYVQRRSGMLWSFAIADVVIAGVAIPVLVYIAVTTEQDVERLAMLSMITITVAAVVFGWWNRRGVLRSSATTVAEYVAISAERLRRMRAALTIGWLMLAAEVIIFSIWSWNRLYSGPAPPDAGVERFMWLWLAGLTLAAMIGLLYCGRWLTRDTARFESLRRELERN